MRTPMPPPLPDRRRPARRGVLALALWMLAAAAHAQSGPAAALGLEELSVFDSEHLSVEINLAGALLKIVADATEEDDSDFARVISGLESIKVRVASLKDEELDRRAREEIRTAVRRLDEAGWQPVLRVRDEDDEIYLYLAEVGETIHGLVVLFLEPGEEVGLVEIGGEIEPAALGRLTKSLDLPALAAAAAAAKRGEEEQP